MAESGCRAAGFERDAKTLAGQPTSLATTVSSASNLLHLRLKSHKSVRLRQIYRFELLDILILFDTLKELSMLFL